MMNINNIIDRDMLYKSDNVMDDMRGVLIYYKLVNEREFKELQEILINFYYVCQGGVVLQHSGTKAQFSLLSILFDLSKQTGRRANRPTTFKIMEKTHLNFNKHPTIRLAHILVQQFDELQCVIKSHLPSIPLSQIVADRTVALPHFRPPAGLLDVLGGILAVWLGSRRRR